MPSKKAVVGLGNPGKVYEQTRHNVGFRVIDLLEQSSLIKDKDKELGACVLVKPQTMMNNSGHCVRELIEKDKVKVQDILIVCDDVNLPTGKIRFRPSGSSGGQRGLESVIAQLNTDQIARLRIGVGQEPLPEDLSGFVLSEFETDESKTIEEVLERCTDAVRVWLTQGTQAAMNQYN